MKRKTSKSVPALSVVPGGDASARANDEFFRMIVENGEDFCAVLDLEGRRIYNSPSYANLFGDIGNMKGTDSFAEIHPDDRDLVKRAFEDTVRSGSSHRLHFRFVLTNGHIRYMESCGVLIKNSQGQAFRVVVVSRDITERTEKVQEVYRLAFHDPLTRLPNRRLLGDRLDQALATSKRNGKHGAVILIDLDSFKAVNDEYGHDIGDFLLIEVGRRISSCVRATDTVSRFGGDEFVLVLSELDEDKEKSTMLTGIVAEKIRASLAESCVLNPHHEDNAETTIEYHCKASIGVALFVGDKASSGDIIKWADNAMYKAKEAGGNLIWFYDLKV
jgi:diguanylate cyclase (GGDEF)-like protein/PAS domain S-box-containing protein